MSIWFDLHSIKNISDIIGYIFTIIRPWDPITAAHPSKTRCKKRTLISESAKVVRKTNHIWTICRIIVTRFYSQTCYFAVETLSTFYDLYLSILWLMRNMIPIYSAHSIWGMSLLFSKPLHNLILNRRDKQTTFT